MLPVEATKPINDLIYDDIFRPTPGSFKLDEIPQKIF